MSTNPQWSSHEIKVLQNLYGKKWPIKSIAKLLGRSQTSTNKAISRFGLRAPKNSNQNREGLPWGNMIKNRIHSPSSGNSPLAGNSNHRPQALIEKITIRETCPQYFVNQARKILRQPQKIWVSFGEMVSYLEKQGYVIKPPPPHFPALNFPIWLMNKKIVGNHNMLVEANKIRIAKNQPLFLVKDITCC